MTKRPCRQNGIHKADEMNHEQRHAPKRLHCREFDGKRTGILDLNDNQLELYFVGYDDPTQISEEGPVYVVTEEGRVASLHDNVASGHSWRQVSSKFESKGRDHQSSEYRRIYQSAIISNLAVIGGDVWRPDDLVQRLRFDVAHTQRILGHREKLRSLARASHPSDEDLKLYRAVAGNVVLKADYTVTYSGDTGSLHPSGPTFSIEFPLGCPLNEIAAHLVRYTSFLSFVLGERMAPAAVRVDRLSFQEMVRALKENTYVGDYEVMWSWPADEHEAQDLAFRGAPFRAYDDIELAAFEAGLAEWVNRSVVWEHAYIRMIASLRLRRVVSGERLLAAWRWFEELPNAGAERAFDGTALEPVIRAASDAAHNQGLGDVEDRIRGALRQLGEEAMRDRFARLVGSVRAHFGGGNLLDGMVDHLVNARRFRGRVAHGHFAERDEAEGRRFYKAILAMEALCILLTARDLPMTSLGKKQIWSYPILVEYRLAYS